MEEEERSAQLEKMKNENLQLNIKMLEKRIRELELLNQDLEREILKREVGG